MSKCKCGCGLDAITSEIPYEYKRPEVGPVRTVTTTRQEIIPGVYGCVEVHGMSRRGFVDVSLDEEGLSVDQLTAAISTLTAIRDAMQANTTA